MCIRCSKGSCLSPVSYNLFDGIPTFTWWPKTIFSKYTSILRSDSQSQTSARKFISASKPLVKAKAISMGLNQVCRLEMTLNWWSPHSLINFGHTYVLDSYFTKWKIWIKTVKINTKVFRMNWHRYLLLLLFFYFRI